MPDREKVIKEFELFIKEFHPACTSEGVELDMFREVLTLLKEQPEIVRCDECRKNKMCDMTMSRPLACYCDFFCADGERKDSDA